MKCTLFLGLVLFSLLVSCSVGPSYSSPSIEIPLTWKNHQQERGKEETLKQEAKEKECVYLDYWWQVFKDAKLEELENSAIQNNKNLFVAYERIQEARALRGIAAANFYPQITLDPQTTNTVELVKNFNRSGQNESNLIGKAAKKAANKVNQQNIYRIHELLYFLPINLSYEVDLWGKIQDQYDSATYNWLAQKQDYAAVMLNLTSSLATTYYQLRAADAQIDHLSKIIETRQKAFEINTARYEEGLTFYADVTLAKSELETVLAQHDEVRRQRNLLEDQLAVLIGIPASEFHLTSMPIQGLPPCIPEGIPSEVLLRRPDIREAEYNARSEHALVKQAYSQFFPSLILTAAGGFESPIFKAFLASLSRYWMDAVNIHQLIFDGGRTSSNLKLHLARFLEANGSYQQQVLVAFQEVEDALFNVNMYAQQYELALETTQLAQKTHQLYSERYKSGVIYYIDVSNTERDVINYQLNVAALQGYRYIATIQLIKALGGGW